MVSQPHILGDVIIIINPLLFNSIATFECNTASYIATNFYALRKNKIVYNIIKTIG